MPHNPCRNSKKGPKYLVGVVLFFLTKSLFDVDLLNMSSKNFTNAKLSDYYLVYAQLESKFFMLQESLKRKSANYFIC